jgi:UDP:flavonoid glycosyltransferase YjiC (YdhE family)
VRIGIQTWGSEGDIRPFVALGHALTKRGHQVELVYTEIGERRYEAIAASLGFTARGIASPVVSPERAIAIGLQLLRTRNQLQQGLVISRRLLEPTIQPTFDAAMDLCRRSDLFIHHFILHSARAAADLTQVPAVTLQFAHMLIPSRAIHPPGTPKLGAWGNALGWKVARLALNLTLLRDMNRFRATVGLPPVKDLMQDGWPSHRLNLVASSPALIERPADWPEWNQLCGFLELPAHEHEDVSPDLEAFLRNGAPPVFMGFGSLMPIAGNMHLTATLDAFEEAARLAGCRAIIQSEANRPSTDSIVARSAPVDQRVLFVNRTPHKLVFPRCAAVVHHAGAGTTHATLRAGVPSVPVPHVSDQFGWSDELHRLGVAPRPIRRAELSAALLAARIAEAIAGGRMRRAALAISARMQSDNGPETAADLIESVQKLI